MKKLDKKQVPQFVVLCVLAVGVFGWFAMKMILPTPAAAQSGRPEPAVQRVASASQPTGQSETPAAPGTAAAPSAAAPAAALPADSSVPPPTVIRDPFAVAYTDTPPAPAAPKPAPAAPAAPIRMVSRLPAPPAPSLPMGLGSFPLSTPGTAADSRTLHNGVAPLPVTLPPPAWTVTGVLQSDDERVAILRNGASRRIVHTGDMVDSQYRVISVTRSSVVLRHGEKQYNLMLGGDSPTPASPGTLPAPAIPFGLPSEPAPTSAPAAARISSAPLLAAPALSAMRSVYSMTRHAARLALLPLPAPALRLVPADTFAAVPPSHLRGAGSAPKWAQFHIASASLRPMFGDAHAHLELGIALYQGGKRAEGRNEWQKVLTMDDFDAADEAGKMLYRYQ